MQTISWAVQSMQATAAAGWRLVWFAWLHEAASSHPPPAPHHVAHLIVCVDERQRRIVHLERGLHELHDRVQPGIQLRRLEGVKRMQRLG